MRIAIVSDIHGNAIALDAVVADARSLGVEQFWFIGDFAAIGPEPAAVLDCIAGLEGARCTRGNTDRYIVTGEGPPPGLEAVRSNPALIPTYAGIAASLAWTRGYVTASGWFEWLEHLPLEIGVTSPAGVRILAVHASPGNDDGEGVHPGRSNSELSSLLAGSDADLVFVGHTHEPMVRRIGQTVIVNLGSVSNPMSSDLRACYAILETTSSSTEFRHRHVSYDQEAFVESVRRSRHPAAEFILSFQRGEHQRRAPHADQTSFTFGENIRVEARCRDMEGAR